MPRAHTCRLILVMLCALPLVVPADDTIAIFVSQAERLPTCANVEVSTMEGAEGGTAVALNSHAARVGARVELAPGAYTLLFSALADSPEQDAIYVTVAGQLSRIAIGELGEFDKWVVRKHTFQVRKAGEYDLLVEPDPNELGVAIDQVALVRGALPEITEMADVPRPAANAALAPVSGIKIAQTRGADTRNPTNPGVREFKLASLPDKPHERSLDTLFYCSFDESHDADYARGNGACSAVKTGELVKGKWGKALDCTNQEVNVYFNAYRNLAPRAGTLECWVQSGETNIWADGQDHCFFRLNPRRILPGRGRAGVTLAVTKQGKDNALHLQATGGLKADLSLPTDGLDPAQWRHLAISWDFTGGARQLWLCLDGKGRHSTLEAWPTTPVRGASSPDAITLAQEVGAGSPSHRMRVHKPGFSATPLGGGPLPEAYWSLQIGNIYYYKHHAHVGEFSPLGGYLDDLHISDETLARREAGFQPLDIGELDAKAGLAVEDSLHKYLDMWGDLQLGGVWGDWFSPRIAPNGLCFDWTGRPRDRRRVDCKYGSSAEVAHRFLQAYEYTGDERWLQVAVNTAEFLLRGQDEKGYWYQAYVVDESGGVFPGCSTKWARIQDGYQSQQWQHMLHAYRVTGDKRYLQAATKCADFLLAIQNPNGSWPGTYDASAGVGRTTGPRGVELGCEYNDYATTDPMRMMMTMYHLTGDEKYINGTHGKGIAGIGQWLFDTQMGEGKVRGWCQQYGQDNKPVWSRAFEAPVISPRVVCRFIHPMALWMYLMTGNERYMNLLRETYDWYRSVEVPGPEGGWYYQYLPDGTPVYSSDFKTIKIDPDNPKPGGPKPSRGKLQLTELERTLKQYHDLGPEEFRQSFVRPIELTPEDIAQRRRAAADYCRAHAKDVLAAIEAQRPDGSWTHGDSVVGTLLYPPGRGPAGLVDRYVRNLHLARGVVPVSALPRGGVSPWDIGIRSSRIPIAWISDWFDIPLQEPD